MFLLIKRKMSTMGAPSLRAWIGIGLLEIVIVMVGVYMAARVAEIRDQAQERERQQVALSTLVAEIGPFIEQTGPVIRNFQADLDAWRRQYEAGERPLPFYAPVTSFLARPHNGLWTALLASGALDLLAVEFVVRVADFYEGVERTVERYDRLDEISRERIIPFLNEGPDHFYVDGSNELLPVYDIYMQELQAMISFGVEMVELGEEIAGNSDAIPGR